MRDQAIMEVGGHTRTCGEAGRNISCLIHAIQSTFGAQPLSRIVSPARVRLWRDLSQARIESGFKAQIGVHRRGTQRVEQTAAASGLPIGLARARSVNHGDGLEALDAIPPGMPQLRGGL